MGAWASNETLEIILQALSLTHMAKSSLSASGVE